VNKPSAWTRILWFVVIWAASVAALAAIAFVIRRVLRP
jgi:hypothetical protein